MTVASEITRIKGNIEAAYTAASAKGATLPATENSDNLATCIGTITGSSPVITSLSVTPTTSAQTITAPSGTDGYSPVSVAAVTASIDANITAGNIKDGVTILGVTGNYTGGGSSVGITREVSALGVYQIPANSFSFGLPSDATNFGDYALHYGFYKSTGITSADLSSLTTISGEYAFDYACRYCTSLTSVDLSSLTSVSGVYSLYAAFQDCTNLVSVDLSSLTSVSGDSSAASAFSNTKLTSVNLSSLREVTGKSGCSSMFRDCSHLTSINLSSLEEVTGESGCASLLSGCTSLTSVSFPSLTTIGTSGCSGIFYNCTNLTRVDFPTLTSISGSGLASAFRGCTSITDVYFNGLTTASFVSSTYQFNMMLTQTGTNTTHTLHFPSNLESTIQGLTGYPLFGGSSGYVTLAYDLPATS